MVVDTSNRLHVIGVGYGRTGTDTLKEALNLLGYRTFHTKEMFENQRIFDHFDEQVFRFDHAELRDPDLALVASEGFNATMDMPLSLYYKELYALYPEANFILSMRKSPEQWLQSWKALIDAVSLLPRFAPFIPNIFMVDRYQRWLMGLLHGDDTFLSSYQRHAHSAFLKVDECPSAQDVPFPRANSQAQVQRQMVGMVVVANTALAVGIGVVLYVARRVSRSGTVTANKKD
mmetsp:Transcript_29732/g.34195  ORF Transcript_29732/g.34195 Transcript_29732/m.34195 type:complete len:232 (-) Transcript_29732:572-1267(-)